jgi:hypothetical protein
VRNISKTFFVFLVLSLIIWLLITLSKEYTTQVALNISYRALSQDKLLQKEPTKKLSILAKASGFKLLSTNLLNHNIELRTHNLSKKKGDTYFLLLSKQRNEIQKQLVSGLKIEEFIQDTIYLEIGRLASKKVPVLSNLRVAYHIGFNSLKPIEIRPDSILISGVSSQLKKVKSLTFQPVFLENVNANFTQKASILQTKDLTNINFDTKEITIVGFVEKFTEGNFEIPFTISNIPENLNLTTFPKEVKVVFKVDLPRFNAIRKNSFSVECDYRISEKNGFTYLIPKIIKQPDFVRNVKIVPNKIEYLIQN